MHVRTPRRAFLAVLLALVALPAAAQSLPDWAAPSGAASSPSVQSFAPPPDPPGPPPRVPVDGGLSLLALAGAGLAAHRLKERRARS